MSTFLGIIPIPPRLQAKSRVYDLKARLDWGEPALTIIDIRERAEFSLTHILGAISIPMAELSDRALASLELERDLYIYSETDEETAAAANQLRAIGYKNVSELRGGLPAWKAVGFPIETSVRSVGRRR